MRSALRDLRALRYDPPGYAKKDGRRTTFQSALEQCEQFLTAAAEAGYATRPVQLFYALSQAGRAILAASPQISNQAWRVTGHGLTINTSVAGLNDVTVCADKNGLFPAVAAAIGADALVPGEKIPLRDLWSLLPETARAPFAAGTLAPVLLFLPDGWPRIEAFARAEVAWIPTQVRDLCGNDRGLVKQHLDRYPALRDSEPQTPGPMGGLKWMSAGTGLRLGVEWRITESAIRMHDHKQLRDLNAPSYRSPDDLLVTPAIGSMQTGLHPILAMWTVLLSLASLARYEPAMWSKIIDIDRTADANAVEHLLDEATNTLPATVVHQLSSLK